MPTTSANWVATSGVWTAAANWNTNVVPDSSTNATIANTTTTVDAISGSGQSASLTLSGPVQLLGQFTTGSAALSGYGSALSLGSAGSLTDNGGLSADYNSSVTVGGGTLTVKGSLVGSNLSETLNGGTVTIGGVQASSLYNSSSNRYVVTAGIYSVSGNITRGSASAGDSFNVSGDNTSINGGQFKVAGTVDLGGDTVNAFKGGIIQFATLNPLAGASDTFSVDASSSIEIGTGNGPVAGALTIDAGQTFKDGGSISAPIIVNNGTIEAAAGQTLALNGSGTGLIGTGSIKIDANASLTLQAVGKQSQNTIQFSGAGGTLTISNSSLNASQAFVPVISGFGPTDRLDYQGTVTGTSFSGTTLTLLNGASTVATLTLQGTYGGDTFFANSINGVTQISVSTGGDTTTAPAGTTAADQYAFTPNFAGSWDNSANWVDTTSGQSPATLAPGANDLVTIAAISGAVDVVTGVGNSASLTLGGSVDLKGRFTTAALSLQYNAGVTVDAGAALTDSGDFNNDSYGRLTIAGGALAVAGNVIENYGDSQTLSGGSVKVGGIKIVAGRTSAQNSYTITGGAYEVTGSYASGNDNVIVSNAGQFKVDGNTALGSDYFRTSNTGAIQLASVTTGAAGSDTFYVSDTSSIEIGTKGGAAAGSFTLDAGQTLTDGGSITAPGDIVVNGTLAVGDGETMTLDGGTYGYNSSLGQYRYTGGLAGSGQITIGNNAILNIAEGVDAASANIIAFAGTGGVLDIASYALTASGAFLPAITGFGPTDRIQYGGAATSATYSGGVLTLLNGASTVATLKIALDPGSVGSSTPVFITNYQNGVTQISVSTGGDTATAPPGTTTPDLYTWNTIQGSWDKPASWIDTTSGANPAAVAPGAKNLVTIASASGVVDVVTGVGNSASLTLGGSVDLKGQFTTAALSLQYNAGVTVDAGAVLTDSGDFNNDSYGRMTIAGGALTVAGNVIENYGDSQTLSGGSVKVGGIKIVAGRTSAQNSYTITGGAYEVTGSYASGNDNVIVSNAGQFKVDGNTALGSDYFRTSNTGAIQLASVTTGAAGSDTFYVSDTSSIEIGTKGGAAAGSFTLDAGQTLTDGGSITAPGDIVINGTLAVGDGETMTLDGGTYGYNSSLGQYRYTGGLAGSGQITIGNNAILNVAEGVDAASANIIAFAGTGGVLDIASYALTASGAFLPAITGFGPTDRIQYGGAATSATYSGGVLTLLNGASTVATLKLALAAGTPNPTFFANSIGGVTQIAVSTGGDTVTAPAGTTAADQYAFTPNFAGSWDNPANWVDTTSGQSPATLAPGANDLVTIAAISGAVDVVTGIGNSASLTLGGSVDLKGRFTTAALSLQYNTGVTVDAGAALTDSGDFNNDSYGRLTIAGGALAVAGNVIENYGDSQTLSGGSVKVGGIKIVAGRTSAQNSYTITGGAYEVTGSYASGNDNVIVSNAGRFKVDGNTALGSDYFRTSNTGAIQLASVTTGAAGSDTFYVSDTSTIEIGTKGGAAAGSFTLDAGQTLTDGGSITAPGDIVINGTLAVGDGETLNLDGGTYGYNSSLGQYRYTGGLAGSGQITIGNNAILNVAEGVDASSTNTIAFKGTGGVLDIASYALTASGAFLPAITGFGPTDRIQYGGAATSASYSSGVLTLLNGTSTVATLKIALAAGTPNPTFFANSIGGGTQIAVSTGGDTATAPAGTTAADQYAFTPNFAGSWDNSANWVDTTSGQSPATLAPGANDLVTIAAISGAVDVVTGVGNSASLTLGGSVDLKGRFTTAALSLQYNAGVTVDAGAALTDSGDFNNDSYGRLTIAGGALAVAGNVIENYGDSQTLSGGSVKVGGIKIVAGRTSAQNSYTITGGAYEVTGSYASGNDNVIVSNAGQFKVDGNTALGSDYFRTSNTGAIQLASVTTGAAGSDTFYVSDTSSIEIGTKGGAAAGSFTLDAGQTLTDGGSITAPGDIVVNGTLAVGDGETLNLYGGTYGYNSSLGQYRYTDGLAGSGLLTIGNNAILNVAEGVDASASNTIAFAGTGGVLDIASYALTSSGAFMPAITGFGSSDVIDYGAAVTKTVYNGGVLTLLNGTAIVGTLKVALDSSYSNPAFQATALSSNATKLTVVTNSTNTPPALTFSGVSFTDSGKAGDGVTNQPGTTFTGTVSGSAAITSVEVYSGSTDLGAATVSGTQWTLTKALPDGTYTNFFAIATDSALSTSLASNATGVTVDTTPPAPPHLNLSSLGAGPSPVLSGTAEAGTTVTLLDGTKTIGTTSANATTGAFSFAALSGLTAGEHDFSAKAGDLAGNTGTASTPLDVGVGTGSSTGHLSILSGGVANGTTVTSGAFLDVASGGATSAALLGGGGTETVYAAGLAAGTVVNSGGNLQVFGGVGSGATVNGGGIERVYAGSALGTVVNSQGILVVSGGVDSGTTLNTGGGEKVLSGGTALATTVKAGATLNVVGGAVVSGAVFSGGAEIIASGYALSGAGVSGTGLATLTVSSGGTATSATVGSGGVITVSGGATSAAAINSGGIERVFSGGTAAGTLVNSRGLLLISGGADSGTTINSGGTETVFSGGTASNTTVKSGGGLSLVGGATVSGTVFSGGAEIIGGGYAVSGTSLAGSGLATLIVSSGGLATSVGVTSGGVLTVSGGVTSAAAINSGGIEGVSAGGLAAGTLVNSAGNLQILGGVASGATIGAGGVERIFSGGAFATVVNNQGLLVVSGGIDSGTTINSGGTDKVFSGGTASATVVTAGGTLSLAGGAVAGGTVVSGGSLIVSSGGTARAISVTGGGAIAVSGGATSAAAINSDGIERVFSGGVAAATVVNSRGTLLISGGVDSGTVVNSGGTERVASGGTTVGATISGGLLDIQAGGLVSGGITFAGVGTLEVDQGVSSGTSAFATPLGAIAVGDTLDLAGLAYGTGAAPTATVSGSVLTVRNAAGASETFTLTTPATTTFSVAKDAGTGILVTATGAPAFATSAPGTATTAHPFAGQTVLDPNAGATDTISIAVSGNGGTLSGAGLAGGAGGLYTLAAGAPSAVTASLDALTFTPAAVAAGTAASTRFTLSDASGAGTTATPLVVTTTIGNGNGLTITAVAGQDTITGTGTGETFVFNAAFGQGSVTDFASHLGTAAGHDTLSLPIAEFGGAGATQAQAFAALLADTSQSGSAPALTTAPNGDLLALPGMTLATIKANQADFTFHA